MTTVTPPAPLTMLSAVARATTTPGLEVYAGRAPSSASSDDVDRYADTVLVAGPTPARRGDGGTTAWTALVQLDLWEREHAEDVTYAASILETLDSGHLDDAGGSRAWRTDLETAERLGPDAGYVRHRIEVRLTILR